MTDDPTPPDDGGAAKDMTALDIFAGNAMAGMLAANDPVCSKMARSKGMDVDELFARGAYLQAEAMLAEKKRRGEGRADG